jgi:arylsulfatase A-like enzyme
VTYGPGTRLVARLLLLGALAVGCSEVGEPARVEGRRFEIRRSLVGFHPEPGFRIATRGRPAMRWLGVDGEPQRAFACAADCGVTFAPQRFRGGFLEAVAAVAPNPGATSPVTFSLRIAVANGEAALVWQESLTAGDSRPVRVRIPDATSALRVHLDVETRPGESPRALWLEPTFTRERTGPLRSPQAPNIVLIKSDTTRQDELSCYGGPTETPAIDRLAREGVLFEDAHSVAFGTNPSHASLMTSSHAARHGVIHNRAALRDELPTLAEVLGDSGYATAAFVGAIVLNRGGGLARGFDIYDDSMAVERSGDLTVSLFERWLAEDPGGPFFAWIHLYDPHQPYAPEEARAARYLAETDDAALLARVDAAIARSARGRPAGFIAPAQIEADDAEVLADVDRIARARYRGEIAFVDELVGRIRDALEERGLLEQTLLAFAADHGENFLDRGPQQAYNHAGLRADVTRVPLVMRLPGGRHLGRSEALVGNLDLAPTIVSLAGIDAPAEWEGRVLVDAAGLQTAGERDHLIVEGSHRREIGVRTRDVLYRELREAVRGRPKVVAAQGFAPGQPFEVYEHASDPGETRNVYRPDHPLLSRLRGFIEGFERGASSGSIVEVSPEQAKALRALGYIDDTLDEHLDAGPRDDGRSGAAASTVDTR